MIWNLGSEKNSLSYYLQLSQDLSSERTLDLGMPGRNMCNFLVLFNLAMWLIDTFQLQNGKSGAVEAEVYGLDSWVLIQRMTVLLPQFKSTTG